MLKFLIHVVLPYVGTPIQKDKVQQLMEKCSANADSINGRPVQKMFNFRLSAIHQERLELFCPFFVSIRYSTKKRNGLLRLFNWLHVENKLNM